jgi:hypothetical protein
LYYPGLNVDTEDKAGRTPLWLAACFECVDCVDVLLAHGANPHHMSKNEGAPVDIATSNGHSIVISMMTASSYHYASSVISQLKEKSNRQEKLIDQLEKEKEELLEEMRQIYQQGPDVEEQPVSKMKAKDDETKEQAAEDCKLEKESDRQAGGQQSSYCNSVITICYLCYVAISAVRFFFRSVRYYLVLVSRLQLVLTE